jgi:hypothetical protein
MIKNQASGRQDKIVRSVDYAMNKYFQLLAQMMTVWYTEPHYATVNGGDGKLDFIEMHKNKIEKGMLVKVQSGTTLPFDKARQESVAVNLLKMGVISPYDGYKLLHMDDPQQLYDNFMKWKSDPSQLAMDIATNDADADAVVDWTELMSGRVPEDRDDPTKEYIEEMRKLLITDEFMDSKKKIQNNVIKFINKAVDKFELQSELHELSGAPEEPQPLPPQVLATGVPQIQLPMPQMPGIPPQGMPQAMPPQPMGQPPVPPSPMQAIMQQPAPGGVPPVPPSGAPAQPSVNLGNPAQLPPV